MSINTQIDADRNLVTHRVSGHLASQEILGTLEDFFVRPDFKPEMNILVDMQDGSTSKLTSDEVYSVIKTIRELGEKRGQGRSAVVAPMDEDFGITHVIEQLLKNEKRQLKIFRTMPEAMEWLGY